jgi:phosphopantetheine--protein transferase-like protein
MNHLLYKLLSLTLLLLLNKESIINAAIFGVGIDLEEISRFNNDIYSSKQKLEKIFHPIEIAYCSQKKEYQRAECYAARFAAKEATYKALFNKLKTKVNRCIPLLNILQYIYIQNQTDGSPTLIIDINFLEKITKKPDGTNTINFNNLKTHVSLTHTKTAAGAIVILTTKETKKHILTVVTHEYHQKSV